MRRHPVLGITMGDPAGVGPEIIAEALSDKKVYQFCRPVVLGDPFVLSSILSQRPQSFSLRTVSAIPDSRTPENTIDVLAISRIKGGIVPGKPRVVGGKAMVKYIIKAVEMAREGQIDAIVTCPINKSLMHDAGYAYEGHTQLIAHLTNTTDYVMMLAGDRLRVALVTIHCALQQVPLILDEREVYKTITITARSLERDFGLKGPKIAVCALNPHAGESGLFGTEERDIIAPAVYRARKEGNRVMGPFPADTLFHRAVTGEFDAVVAMYHDQGLIPLKLLHFYEAVNVTLGLPIVRTSVDHGTAYEIAGTGRANASSLRAAIQTAAAMVRNRSDRRKTRP